MEQTGNAEAPTLDKQRAIQREGILHEHIKKPSVRSLILKLIPSDRLSPNTSADTELLKQLAESLGKDTHTVLFGLAVTAKSPAELSKILRKIVNLKKISPLHWKFEESEAHFLNRDLPESINVSEGAKEQAENMLDSRNAVENDSNPQYLLESFFYIFSRKDVSLADKRRILNEFYRTNGLTLSLLGNLGNKNAREIYDSRSSFWNQVDGLWIYPDSKQSKKPNPVLTAVKNILGGRKQYEEKSARLLARIADLEQKLEQSRQGEEAKLPEVETGQKETKIEIVPLEKSNAWEAQYVNLIINGERSNNKWKQTGSKGEYSINEFADVQEDIKIPEGTRLLIYLGPYGICIKGGENAKASVNDIAALAEIVRDQKLRNNLRFETKDSSNWDLHSDLYGSSPGTAKVYLKNTMLPTEFTIQEALDFVKKSLKEQKPVGEVASTIETPKPVGEKTNEPSLEEQLLALLGESLPNKPETSTEAEQRLKEIGDMGLFGSNDTPKP